MRKASAVFLIFCISFFGSSMTGYCQYDSSSESNIEQSESEIGQNLESEISEAQAQADADVEQVESAMDSGRAGE